MKSKILSTTRLIFYGVFLPLFVRFGVGVLHILSILTIELKRNKFEAIRRALGWLIIATPILWVLLGLVDVTRQLNGSLERNNEILNPIIKVWTPEEMRMEELEKELQKANERIKKLEDFDRKLEEGDKEAIKGYIELKFGAKAKIALAIATCESNISHDRVGDTNLTFIRDGVEYGKSYGVFQIRHLKGRPDPKWLFNAKNNVDYAVKVSNNGQNFNAWYNCSKKIGIL